MPPTDPPEFVSLSRQADREGVSTFAGATPDIESGGVPPGPAKASLLIPLTIGATFFMEGLDTTIVATSLPEMSRSLGVAPNEIGVAMTAYLISICMWMSASGWFADRFEARRVYVAAILLFVGGSLICGFSNDLYTLVAGRFIQGAGGAMMTPIGRLILARSFARDELVKAMSFMIIPGLLGPMLGPVIGGWITMVLDWRWIFFVNVPLGAIGIFLSLRYLHSIEGGEAPAFDWKGFTLLAVALAALASGLELVSATGGVGLTASLLLAVAAAGLAAYGLHARGPSPILDLRLFRYRAFAVSVLGGSFSRIMLGAAIFVFPLFLQLGLGATAFAAGLLMGVMSLGQIAVRPVMDRILRFAGVRWTLIGSSIGMALLLPGLLGFARGDALWPLGILIFVFGLVHSIQLSTLMALSFSGLPGDALARATSIAAVLQRLTTALGITFSAILLGVGAQSVHLEPQDFLLPILALSAMMAASVLAFLPLRQEDGLDLIGNG